MEIRVLTPMAKVFPDQIPERYQDAIRFEGLRGETIAVQIAYRELGVHARAVRLDWSGVPGGRAFRVRCVPVLRPVGDRWDGDYLREQPGQYPDLLEPLPCGGVCHASRDWQAVLLLFENLAPDEYNLRCRFTEVNGATTECVIPLRCLPAELPPQTLKYTRWFHCDALAEYYHVPVFSPEHWRVMGNFLRAAAWQGMNMVLTPIHTPPLDTAVGLERPTVQLVDITVEGNAYRFGFDQLDRWIDLCEAAGIRYFEMAHLYSQWGARCAPKIVANVGGETKRIFGWETPALSSQ